MMQHPSPLPSRRSLSPKDTRFSKQTRAFNKDQASMELQQVVAQSSIRKVHFDGPSRHAPSVMGPRCQRDCPHWKASSCAWRLLPVSWSLHRTQRQTLPHSTSRASITLMMITRPPGPMHLFCPGAFDRMEGPARIEHIAWSRAGGSTTIPSMTVTSQSCCERPWSVWARERVAEEGGHVTLPPPHLPPDPDSNQ